MTLQGPVVGQGGGHARHGEFRVWVQGDPGDGVSGPYAGRPVHDSRGDGPVVEAELVSEPLEVIRLPAPEDVEAPDSDPRE